jgi:hypothetical protein
MIMTTRNTVSKMALCIAVGILATFFVYYGLQDSLSRQSLSRIPLPSSIAVSIVAEITQDTKDSTPSFDPANFSARYIYIKGNGDVFESELNSNTVGKFLRSIGEPTSTTGNHFAWEVLDKNNNASYFVDATTGQLIAESKS